MKSFILGTAALALSSGLAFADATGCNPAISNWVNAAPTTCPVSDGGGDTQSIDRESQYHPPCEHPDKA